MSAAESLRQALRLLRAHKLRSALTLFGVVWGTASVIFLVGWGDGLAAMLEGGILKASNNMGNVFARRIGEDFTPAVDRRFLWFTQEDVEVLRRRARLPARIGAQTQQWMPVAYGQRAMPRDVRGVDPQMIEIRGVEAAVGRLITEFDLAHRRRVVVLGSDARKHLLGPSGGLGTWIRIAGTPFRVVGILAPVGAQLVPMGARVDEQLWTPITTFQEQWPKDWTDESVVWSIFYQVHHRSQLDQTEEEIQAILAERLRVRPDDDEAMHFRSPLKILSAMPIAETQALLFVLAAAILVIGGVGTLNMMLDSVHERRQEIGVRLAIGASRRDVVIQFFFETLALVGLAGALGVALGVGSCLALGGLGSELIPVPVLSWRIVVVAVGVLGFVALASGVIPAWRASRIDPAITLRMD